MVRQLSQAREDDSDDSINDAIRQADAMADNIEFLDGVKGTDSSAKTIIEHYPDYINQLVKAGNALAKLKDAQLRQNKKVLWKLCAEEDENLRKAVKQSVDPPDPAGVDKIPELADKARDQIHDEFARQLDQVNEISRARDDARNFSISVGGWSDVTSQMRNATDSIWGVYDAQLKNTRDKCTDLDKGKDNPLIVECDGEAAEGWAARCPAAEPALTNLFRNQKRLSVKR